jgi:carbonic anhydrase
MTFPRLRKQVEAGEISIHGAFFGVAAGKLSVLDQATGEFKPVAAEDHARLFAQPRF